MFIYGVIDRRGVFLRSSKGVKLSISRMDFSIMEKLSKAAVIIFMVIAAGGIAVIFEGLSGPTCSLQSHEVRAGDRPTMLAVIRQDTLGASDLPTDFLVKSVTDLNPNIDPGNLRPSTRLTVPDECKN